ncbi:MAG: hypothetical protein AB9903_12915 [Vulcanimicrobiota bacterium]
MTKAKKLRQLDTMDRPASRKLNHPVPGERYYYTEEALRAFAKLIMAINKRGGTQ